MLTLDQIIELQEKGFTYEQLQMLNSMNLTTPEPSPDNEPKTEPEAGSVPTKPEAGSVPTKPEAGSVPTKPEKPETPAEAEQDTAGELNKKIDELTATVKAIQAQNVKRAEQDAPKKQTAEDVIRSFMVAS